MIFKKSKRVIAIIQARMSSTRLPGKVLMTLAGDTALLHCYERVNRAKGIDKTVIATTTNPADDVLVKYCEDNGIEVFRGSEDDVLRRVTDCAEFYRASVTVEVTADCPAVCTEHIESMIESMKRSQNKDYISNTMIRSFPDGCDVQVYKIAALKSADYHTKKKEHRSHVGWNIWNNKNINAKCYNIADSRDLSKIEITLDEYKDYQILDRIFTWFNHIEIGNKFTYKELVDYIYAHPDMLSINKSVKRKTPGQG